jgi:hypothetical protein
MIPPSLLVFSSSRGGPIGLPLRASNEGSHLNNPSKLAYFSLREWPRLPSAARIGRAQFYRARSASKEGTWPLPPHRFHLMLQPMLAFWLLSTALPANTASIALRRSRPVTGLLLPGRLSSSCPR